MLHAKAPEHGLKMMVSIEACPFFNPQKQEAWINPRGNLRQWDFKADLSEVKGRKVQIMQHSLVKLYMFSLTGTQASRSNIRKAFSQSPVIDLQFQKQLMASSVHRCEAQILKRTKETHVFKPIVYLLGYKYTIKMHCVFLTLQQHL